MSDKAGGPWIKSLKFAGGGGGAKKCCHDCRLRQKHFLGKAASLGSAMSVKQAFRFLEILPHEFTNLQTYNMVVTVCIRARDMAAAMQAADILRSTGRKPDAVLYNNLIKGESLRMLLRPPPPPSSYPTPSFLMLHASSIDGVQQSKAKLLFPALPGHIASAFSEACSLLCKWASIPDHSTATRINPLI